MASARLLPKEERRKAVDRALAACGLEGAARKQRIESLSKGFRQRVGLAQAIVHDPPILILDEPTSGLDPNQIIEIRALIRELGKSKTVILSTHVLSEVEAVCSRVLILNEGRIAAQGTPEEIAQTLKSPGSQASRETQASIGGYDTWELYMKGAQAADIENRIASLGLSGGTGIEISGLSAETTENGIIRLCFSIRNTGSAVDSSAENGEQIFDWAVSHGYKIIGMTRKKISLEDIFVKLTSEERGSMPLTSEERGSMPLTNEQGMEK